ncbi:carbohydrate ABC transporter permease [Halorussus sp. AFM4]|uniref:carbohydrate ABC transporter permease n=1 Tax=Halorussus sp. AFM4 TaxID=3421651 RepID=UPI003EBFDA08
MSTIVEYIGEPGQRIQNIRDTYGGFKDAIKENWFSYALFLPTLLLLLLVVWLPMLQGVWMSFHSWPISGNIEWVGLGNYQYLFTWSAFWTSLKATLIYSMVTFMMLGIALVAALLVANLDSFENLLSMLFMVPYTMPPVVTGTVWMFLLHPNLGPIFNYLVDLGILQQPIYWSTKGPTALAGIMGAITWTFWPFIFLILLATLESIPEEHYESARMYGANRFQQFWHVTLPQLKSAILVAISIRMVWNLTKVSQPLQLTGGGPGYKTSLLSILLYRQASESGQLGRGFAIGMVLLAITLAFVVVFIREFEKSRGV